VIFFKSLRVSLRLTAPTLLRVEVFFAIGLTLLILSHFFRSGGIQIVHVFITHNCRLRNYYST
jgi:hypothetical protein